MTQLGGTFTFPTTTLTVNRMGYGAMQLAGPHVFGPPKDIDAALAVLHSPPAFTCQSPAVSDSIVRFGYIS